MPSKESLTGLPPDLNSTEWIWFFGFVLTGAAKALQDTVSEESQMDAEIAILGKPVPFKGQLVIDPEKQRKEFARFRESYKRILEVALYFKGQAMQRDIEEFSTAVSEYLDRRKRSK